MPRKRLNRRVVEPPNFKGYKPYGSHTREKEPVELLFEEYETIKLTDYKDMTHQEACKRMGISRATFARIYENARSKIAKALVEAREIETIPGKVTFDESWFLCNDCYNRFTLQQLKSRENCPSCSSSDYNPIA